MTGRDAAHRREPVEPENRDAWTGEPDPNEDAVRFALDRTVTGGKHRAGHACRKEIRWRDIVTSCVLDAGHKGVCQNYAHVLNLNVPQNHPLNRKVGKCG